MKSSCQLKFVKIKEIQVKMNFFQSVPDLSYHCVSSARFHYVHLINNMSFVPAGVKLIEKENRCFVLCKQETREMDFNNKSNTTREQKPSSRVA